MKKRIQKALGPMLLAVLCLSLFFALRSSEKKEPPSPVHSPEPLLLQSVSELSNAKELNEYREEQQPESPDEQAETDPEEPQAETLDEPAGGDAADSESGREGENFSGEYGSEGENFSGEYGREGEYSGGEYGEGAGADGRPDRYGEAGESGENTGGGEDEGGKEGEGIVSGDIATNLPAGTLTRSDPRVVDDIISFYAYATDPSKHLSLLLRQRKAGESGWTRTALSGAGDYDFQLVYGENVVEISLLDSTDKVEKTITRTIRYMEDLAARDNPAIGRKPPTILTEPLEHLNGDHLVQSELVITVQAFWDDRQISATDTDAGITVYMDDVEQKNTPTGGAGQWEYHLFFQRPEVGDFETHCISVRAWYLDENGEVNSAFKDYRITYDATDESEYLGEALFVIDASTVGLGVLDEISCAVYQGESVAAALLRALAEYNYEPIYDKSVKLGFYLRGLSRPGAFTGAAVPERLQDLIERDGIAFFEPCTDDTLAEFDFTACSGWLYSINGTIYPGQGMSERNLSPGDTVYLRFSLAYGKDVGGYVSSGEKRGNLRGYCCSYLNGECIEFEHSWEESGRAPHSDGEAGFVEYTCDKCGEIRTEKTDHEYEEAERVEPGPTEDGYVEYVCSCGDSYRITLPATGEEDLPEEDLPPEDENEEDEE